MREKPVRPRAVPRAGRDEVSREQVFTLEATPLKYGRGAAADAGWELERLGVKRAMLVSDPGVAAAGITDRVRESVEAAGISVEVWDRARVEPTDESFGEAAAFAVDGGFDGFVGIGGGSSIDTAKVSDLIATHGGEIMDYVNAPVGEGRKPPSPLKPLLAIPTTCGSGAEATTVAILDIPEQHVKTGISHRYLRPDQAIVDPELTASLPRRGGRLVRARRHLPRRRVVRRQAVLGARAAGVARRPPALPGVDADLGHLVGQGARVRRPVPARRGRRRRGGARLDDARRLAGRDRVRRRRRAHPARLRVSDRRAQARVPAARLSGRPRASSRTASRSSSPPRPPSATRYEAAPDRHRRAAELLAGEPLPDADEETLPRLLLELMRDVGVPTGHARAGLRRRATSTRWSRAR